MHLTAIHQLGGYKPSQCLSTSVSPLKKCWKGPLCPRWSKQFILWEVGMGQYCFWHFQHTGNQSYWVVPWGCFPPVENFHFLDGSFCIQSIAFTILFSWHTHEKMENTPVWLFHCFCECWGIHSSSGYTMGNCCHVESPFCSILRVAVYPNSLIVVFSM